MAKSVRSVTSQWLSDAAIGTTAESLLEAAYMEDVDPEACLHNAIIQLRLWADGLEYRYKELTRQKTSYYLDNKKIEDKNG